MIMSDKISGVYYRDPEIFYDHRGEYVNIFNGYYFATLGFAMKEDDVSLSHKNVLRGLHGDNRTAKLIQCLYGEIILAVVDMRDEKYSWEIFHLNDRNRRQVLVPAGCVNGHYILSDKAIFAYKQSEYYKGAENQMTVRWNDPEVGIDWGVPNMDPILSIRDSNVPLLSSSNHRSFKND